MGLGKIALEEIWPAAIRLPKQAVPSYVHKFMDDGKSTKSTNLPCWRGDMTLDRDDAMSARNGLRPRAYAGGGCALLQARKKRNDRGIDKRCSAYAVLMMYEQFMTLVHRTVDGRRCADIVARALVERLP